MNPIGQVPQISLYPDNLFFLIAGPCVVEDIETTFLIAETLKKLAEQYHLSYIFKASFRKANRSRYDSFTGIGDLEALRILKSVSEKYKIPVISDVHSEQDIEMAEQYIDIIQIPAFLSRQTSLLVAAGKTGKPINIKKGQFLSAEAMGYAVEKVCQTGNSRILVTERGSMFGYNDLIVDFRNIVKMQSLGVTVVLDITHSVQQPNQISGVTGGMPEMISTIAKAGIAAGADGIFLETHPYPEISKSDGANMLALEKVNDLLNQLVAIKKSLL